jgi:hypothetical protein
MRWAYRTQLTQQNGLSSPLTPCILPHIVIKHEHWVTKKQDNLTRPMHTLTYRHPPIYAIVIKHNKMEYVFKCAPKFALGMETLIRKRLKNTARR